MIDGNISVSDVIGSNMPKYHEFVKVLNEASKHAYIFKA